MVTGKGVNNHTSLYVHILDTYTSWGPLYPHSRSNHGTETLWGNCKNYNLGHEMWFVDCSCMYLQGQCARRYGGAEL